MSSPAKKFHDVLKKALIEMQQESGTYVTSVDVVWNDNGLVEVSTQMGVSFKQMEEEE